MFGMLDKRKEDEVLVGPNHLAVSFVDESFITFNVICDIITHSFKYGVRRVTFYDPWSIIYSNKEELCSFLLERSKSKLFNGKISFDEFKSDLKRVLHVNFLGAKHGLDGLVRACKNLSSNTKPISVDEISEYLHKEEKIFEADLLVKVGSNHTFLAGFPPFSLRVTELMDVTEFYSTESVAENEFCSILQQFALRDRRLGK